MTQSIILNYLNRLNDKMLNCGDLAEQEVDVGILKCSKCQKMVQKLDSSAIQFCLQAIQSGQLSEVFPAIAKQMEILDKTSEIYRVFASILALKEEDEVNTVAPRRGEKTESPYFQETGEGLRTEFRAIRENSGLACFILQQKSPETEEFIEIHYVPGSPFFELLCKKGLILRNDADVYRIETSHFGSFWDFLADTKILTSKQMALVDRFIAVDQRRKVISAKESEVPLDCVDEDTPLYREIFDGKRRLEFHGLNKEAQLPSFLFDIGIIQNEWVSSVEIRYEPGSAFYELLLCEGIPLRPNAQIYVDKGGQIVEIFKILVNSKLLTANQYRILAKFIESVKESKKLFDRLSFLDDVETNPFFKLSGDGSEFVSIRKDAPILSFRIFKQPSGEKCVEIKYDPKSTFREDFSEYGIWVPKDGNLYVAEGDSIYKFWSFLEDAEYVTEEQAEILQKFVGKKPDKDFDEKKTEAIHLEILEIDQSELDAIPELEFDVDTEMARAIAMSMEESKRRNDS